MKNWRDLAYLQSGNARQQAAWNAISQIRLMESLCAYDPVLAGTIPLQIDVPDSDLDIICVSHDLDRFDADVRAAYGSMEGYQESRILVSGKDSSVIGFYAHDFWFELFAQSVPVEQQNAYRHMVIEDRLLSIGGEEAYRDIRMLKANGMKTEPAFAHYFHIPGNDPYQALLELERYHTEELTSYILLFQEKNQSR
ncbi:DUF4269 domain-containing protein [Brevibacillus choshinensis]|uniref:DUF4269 domain-containing protein n=1 Tax=Brevibacillus choshinensis TaxID=54911 RepID=A0ABX7FHP4_BRECH|nr:DUF4269 domain-containing protein [Brevibacillus choshinensis]QRG65385.1 DUF4269 domain-containing protein [Brevibacillus choshinensis]